MASSNVLELSNANWKTTLDSGTLVVADFWAPWCGPCRMIAPVIDRVADKFAGKNVKIGKVNVDENSELANEYDIATIPRLLFFKDGKKVYEHVSTISDAELERQINSMM